MRFSLQHEGGKRDLFLELHCPRDSCKQLSYIRCLEAAAVKCTSRSNGSKRNGENKNAFHFARPITEWLRAPQVARRLFSERYFPMFCIPLFQATPLSFIPHPTLQSFLNLFTFHLFECKLLGTPLFEFSPARDTLHTRNYQRHEHTNVHRCESYPYQMTLLRLNLINRCVSPREKNLARPTIELWIWQIMAIFLSFDLSDNWSNCIFILVAWLKIHYRCNWNRSSTLQHVLQIACFVQTTDLQSEVVFEYLHLEWIYT